MPGTTSRRFSTLVVCFFLRTPVVPCCRTSSRLSPSRIVCSNACICAARFCTYGGCSILKWLPSATTLWTLPLVPICQSMCGCGCPQTITGLPYIEGCLNGRDRMGPEQRQVALGQDRLSSQSFQGKVRGNQMMLCTPGHEPSETFVWGEGEECLAQSLPVCKSSPATMPAILLPQASTRPNKGSCSQEKAS